MVDIGAARHAFRTVYRMFRVWNAAAGMPVVAAAQSVYEPRGYDIDDRDDGLRITRGDRRADPRRMAGPVRAATGG